MLNRRSLLASALALGGCAAPRAQAPALQRIAFGSCANQDEPQPIWDTVAGLKPDLVIYGGDNVYASQQPWSRATLEAAYAALAAKPEFVRVRAAAPAFAIWDDHDYGRNDAGVEFPHKQASKEAFLAFWQAPADDERRAHEGIHHARTFGPPGRRVQVIGLDTRWFRSAWKPTDEHNAPGKQRYIPDADPTKTMLGAAQWQWLEARLREPADLRLVVSGVQVLAEGHGWERWGNFPLERQKLFDLVARTRANGVLLLSGDRHLGALYRETAGVPYPLLEMTSSGITHPWRAAAEPGPNRLGDVYGELHFGTIDVDWSARSVTLALRDIAGRPQRQHTVRLDQLQPA